MLLVLLLTLSLIPRLFLLSQKGFEIFNADHAVFGLMAKHILEGKWMVYYYGQGYMGSLEAFMGAFIDLIRGMDLYSVQLAPLAFYLLFLIVNFHLLKKLFGVEVSLIANLLLALSPPGLTLLSVTALGGYPETLFFGSLILLGFVLYSESKNSWVLFSAGLASGIGFWVNNLIVMYLVPIGLFCFLRSKFWKKISVEWNWRRIFLLEGVNVPLFIRIAASLIHFGVFLFMVWNAVSFFTGPEISLGGLKVPMASPPFLIKKIKQMVVTLGIDLIVLSLWALGPKKIGKKLKPSFPWIMGFLLGGSPAFLYTIIGGEGYRVIHGSGIVFAKELPAQFNLVIWQGLVEGIWGVPVHFLGQGGMRAALAWVVLLLSLGLFIYYCFSYKKEWGNLLRLRPCSYSYPIFPFLLTIIVLDICLLSNLQAGRYLMPLYFSFAVIFALALSGLKRKIGKICWLMLLFLLAHQGYANFEFIQQIPHRDKIKQGHEAMLQLLETKGIRGAYAHYTTSYVLTFQAKEKIIVAPYRSPDRYPVYTKSVDQLDRVAYIFQEDDFFIVPFQKALDQNKVSYEKISVEPFWVFIIDRTRRTEKGLV